MKHLLMIIVFFILNTLNLYAENRGALYLGITYSSIRYADKILPETINLNTVLFKVGIPINQYFAIELRPTTFGSTDNKSINLGPLSGLYGKAVIPLSAHSNVHGLIGFTGVDIEHRNSLEYKSVMSFSYAVGLDLNIYKNVDLVIEYIKYITIADIYISAIELGLNLNF